MLNVNSVPNMVLSCHGVASGHYTSTQAEPAEVHGIRAYGCRGGEANICQTGREVVGDESFKDTRLNYETITFCMENVLGFIDE